MNTRYFYHINVYKNHLQSDQEKEGNEMKSEMKNAGTRDAKN